ncbi:FAD/NAD(P)-binding protein [uncultured Sphingomonas sp.]|uniref:FAD/NAD(P)-binding protein n=1 Tax=uncultured Sphingomonas sp. TaxID=158754 RepID=UPI0025DFD361|nr:FAD/NAD(P)-binding protein [uncultured Sphingomonas sp.]
MSHPAAPKVSEVAIVGAGFSGTLQAINLIRHDGPRAILIEQRAQLARGVAYSTVHPEHLLNVRAGNMSALPDDPDHFVRWLAAEGAGGRQGFARRADYGRYLVQLLHDARQAHPDRLRVVVDRADDIAADGDGVRIGLASGGRIAADVAVLALGNLPPNDPPGFGGGDLPAEIYAADPWSGDVVRGLESHDTVVTIGTGLTMVDVALLLESRGSTGRMIALSRRGLAPRAHADGTAPAGGLAERPTQTGAALLRSVRRRAAAIGWRAAVDELRPHTQGMWLTAPEEEQRRFLRHLRPWWDVHRHRLAPEVAARLARMQADGRLRIVAGKIAGWTRAGNGIDLSWRTRGGETVERAHVRRVINCTGTQGDVTRTHEPLLRNLLRRGLIRPDARMLGIEVTSQAETVDAEGRPNPRLLALGPMTRGAFWEIVAVPDIRVQTWAVARKLANAHWVGGEGL